MIDVSNRMRDIRRSVFPDVQSVVVHNGADPVPGELRARPRPPELRGKLVVSCVSAWYGRKGIPKLVEAFDLVAGQFPDAVLRLVGDGPDRPAVEAAIAAATHREQIQVVGRVPHEQALQEMCWADIYALIGKDEPFATTYTEAMMAGLPLIWPSDCGHNDVLQDRVHGIRVPPWDVGGAAAALGQLLGDGGLRRRMGDLNREFALGSLTWDANARKLIEIFRGAADTARAGAPGAKSSD
jgi:glycosyltransferase involved in cell wall biosynthesis